MKMTSKIIMTSKTMWTMNSARLPNHFFCLQVRALPIICFGKTLILTITYLNGNSLHLPWLKSWVLILAWLCPSFFSLFDLSSSQDSFWINAGRVWWGAKSNFLLEKNKKYNCSKHWILLKISSGHTYLFQFLDGGPFSNIIGRFWYRRQRCWKWSTFSISVPISITGTGKIYQQDLSQVVPSWVELSCLSF